MILVLAFKVWRIGWEKRKHGKVLVLRDKTGRIRKVAHDKLEESRLNRWYEKYNMKERLETLLDNKKLKQHVKRVKRRIRRKGFTHQISLYGNHVNPRTGRKTYRRYEIFHDDKWTQDEVAFIHQWFKTHVPKSRAGVFVFYQNKLYVDEKDELSKLAKVNGGNQPSGLN
jgi:hypothetical protein